MKGVVGGLGRSAINCTAIPGLPGASAVADGRVQSRYHRPELPSIICFRLSGSQGQDGDQRDGPAPSSGGAGGELEHGGQASVYCHSAPGASKRPINCPRRPQPMTPKRRRMRSERRRIGRKRLGSKRWRLRSKRRRIRSKGVKLQPVGK